MAPSGDEVSDPQYPPETRLIPLESKWFASYGAPTMSRDRLPCTTCLGMWPVVIAIWSRCGNYIFLVCNLAIMYFLTYGDQLYVLMMALRRNPYRKCKIEEVPETPVVGQKCKKSRRDCTTEIPAMRRPAKTQRVAHNGPPCTSPFPAARNGTFAFFNLPREVRDHVLSYLVVRRGRKIPILEAKKIIREQKKRADVLRNREKLNYKRAQTGRPPVAHRDAPHEPLIYLDAMRVSKSLYYEAKDQFYHCNYFSISLDSFPATTVEMPTGWDCSRIKKMQLEVQVKDAQRMNNYIDWSSLFAQFPSLVYLRIVPSFHPRYYEWARLELEDWRRAHFIFRAFFRELLASIPEHLTWKLGQSADPQEDMQLEGRAPVAKKVLWDMYSELGTRQRYCRDAAQVIDVAQR